MIDPDLMWKDQEFLSSNYRNINLIQKEQLPFSLHVTYDEYIYQKKMKEYRGRPYIRNNKKSEDFKVDINLREHIRNNKMNDFVPDYILAFQKHEEKEELPEKGSQQLPKNGLALDLTPLLRKEKQPMWTKEVKDVATSVDLGTFENNSNTHTTSFTLKNTGINEKPEGSQNETSKKSAEIKENPNESSQTGPEKMESNPNGDRIVQEITRENENNEGTEYYPGKSNGFQVDETTKKDEKRNELIKMKKEPFFKGNDSGIMDYQDQNEAGTREDRHGEAANENSSFLEKLGSSVNSNHKLRNRESHKTRSKKTLSPLRSIKAMKCPYHSHGRHSKDNLNPKETHHEDPNHVQNHQEGNIREARPASKSFVLRTHSQEGHRINERAAKDSRKPLGELKDPKRSQSTKKNHFIKIYKNLLQVPTVGKKKKKIDVFKATPIRNSFVFPLLSLWLIASLFF